MLADQLLDVAAGDVLLVLAYGRVHREVAVLFGLARRLGLRTILVTERSSGRLADIADTVLPIPRGHPGQVALHGATLVALDAQTLTLSASSHESSLSTLDRLARLRGELASCR